MPSLVKGIISDGTLTTNDAYLHRVPDAQEIILFWSIQGAVTGSTPTLQFVLAEVDPGDENTVVGQSATSPVLTGTGFGQISINLIISPTYKVSWTLGGGSPSFGGVYLTTASKTLSNQLSVAVTKPSNTVVTEITGSTSDTLVLAANAARMGATVYNNANKKMYLKLGSAPSTSSYTIILATDGYYEVPFQYTGDIRAVWAMGVSGSALVTEVLF